MDQDPTASIATHFAPLDDPRVERTKWHSLHEILVLTLCAVIGGADDWVAVETFCKAKKAWFLTFLELPYGIPSHDTFGRVFARLDPDTLSRCFAQWMAAVAEATDGTLIAIDGKTLRRSFDRASNKAAVHMVSAWASENRMVLGQVATEEQSNEITAIPRLLELLDISGCIVTIDAMGCQRKIAQKIIDGGGDYVLSLKGNQATMAEEVERFLDWAESHQFQNVPDSYFETVDGDHGRIETRRCWCTGEVDWFEQRSEWKGLSSFGMVEAERTVGEKTSTERRYFISSLEGTDAEQFAWAVRGHWGIENGLHWVLDIAFREDESRVRKDQGPTNLATLRHIALNLLQQEKTAKIGVANKRLRAGWDEQYLLKVLAGG